MKTLPILTSSLVLSALLLTARAQTPTTTPAKPTAQPAEQRAATYKGPNVVKDTKALGQKMVQKSKPTDSMHPRTPIK